MSPAPSRRVQLLLAAPDADLIMDLADIRSLVLKTQASILEKGFLGFNDGKHVCSPSGSACFEVGLHLGFGFGADFCETSAEMARLGSQ